MAKLTSLSDPSIPIGPGLHVVRLSGRGFGQTLVWLAHLGAKRTCFTAHVWFGVDDGILKAPVYLLHGAHCNFASEMKWSGDKIKGKNYLIT